MLSAYEIFFVRPINEKELYIDVLRGAGTKTKPLFLFCWAGHLRVLRLCDDSNLGKILESALVREFHAVGWQTLLTNGLANPETNLCTQAAKCQICCMG